MPPKMAVYGVHPGRSREALLRSRRMLPKSDFTTSSLEPPSVRHDPVAGTFAVGNGERDECESYVRNLREQIDVSSSRGQLVQRTKGTAERAAPTPSTKADVHRTTKESAFCH